MKAERKTIETALKKGLHPRVELADIKQAAPYLEMGVKHFCIGWDVRILHDWWRVNGEGMRGDADRRAAAASAAAQAKRHNLLDPWPSRSCWSRVGCRPPSKPAPRRSSTLG